MDGVGAISSKTPPGYAEMAFGAWSSEKMKRMFGLDSLTTSGLGFSVLLWDGLSTTGDWFTHPEKTSDNMRASRDRHLTFIILKQVMQMIGLYSSSDPPVSSLVSSLLNRGIRVRV